jgi:CheY-like chemotaxis protein/HPt (histidine-containing phosphotransfer) domain-containing protein
MTGKMTKPRILLVEDDPVSRHFLSAVAEGLPASVTCAETCAAAREKASRQTFDLWLIDANLPDGNGADLLAQLRTMAAATPALAHTASEQCGEHDALRAAGFIDVLVKPIAARALQSSLRQALGMQWTESDDEASAESAPDWDDVAALAALNGQQAHVIALRQLFMAELPKQRQAVVSATEVGDSDRARQTLHLLRASCGFVGARRLDAAVRALEADPQSRSALERFETAIDALSM